MMLAHPVCLSSAEPMQDGMADLLQTLLEAPGHTMIIQKGSTRDAAATRIAFGRGWIEWSFRVGETRLTLLDKGLEAARAAGLVSEA